MDIDVHKWEKEHIGIVDEVAYTNDKTFRDNYHSTDKICIKQKRL